MRYAKLGLLLCSGIWACSGRYVSNPSEGAGADVGVGASSATTGGTGAQPGVTPPDGSGASNASGGSTAAAGAGEVAGAPPTVVDDAACGVAAGQPAAIAAPITNYMMWWFRLSKLIWAGPGHAPPSDLPFSISYQQAGQIADKAIDLAIAETQGIPGAEPFVRDWLRLQDPTAALQVDWTKALSKGPAVETMLALPFDKTRVGALTERTFLAEHPSISARGTVMLEAVFSQQAPPPPPGLPPLPASPGLTRREALGRALAGAACAACHQLIDPLGFSLENYDEYGKYVSFDAGKPVDASGSYRLPGSGGQIEFKDIADLSRQLTNTCDANLALADRFLLFAVQQSRPEAPPAALDPSNQVERVRMRQAFMRSGRTYRSLIKAFAQGQAIRAD